MESDRQRVLFVHAHPDDETLSTGATIATLIAAGSEVTVVTCTRGKLGEVIPPELQHLTGTELGAYRSTELDAALAALSVTDHRMLGEPGARWTGREPRRYLDSGMRWGKSGALPLDATTAGSLTAADLGEVSADIAAAIIDVEPHVVVSYSADGGYGHPDHVRAHEATRAAAEVLHVPFYVIDSDGATTGPVRVDPAPVLSLVTAALAAHRTQVSIDGDSYSLSSGPAHPIAHPESFTRVRPVGSSFRDNGIVSRIAACALALVLGIFAGATLTAAHQATVVVAGVDVPWGIIASIVITIALIAGLRIVFDTRLVAGFAAIGLVGTAALFSLQSTGGSVLVPDNVLGYGWTFAPVVITLVVLGWPRVNSQARARARDIIEVPAAKG